MKKLIFIGFVFSMVSCGFNRTKHYEVYKMPIISNEKKVNFEINGIYAPDKNYKGHLFFFYRDGSVLWGNYSTTFWNDPDEKIKQILNRQFNYLRDEYWGHYSITNDTITIQVFNRDPNYFYKRWILEFSGLIKNDTALLIHSCYYYRTKNQYIEEPIPHYLYRTNLKPDSTMAMFNNRKWFKKNLHESRKGSGYNKD